VRLLPGLGTHHHPIATRSADAQRFFDQGLRLVFAFNHEEAVRSFEQAAALDPAAAMPHWGIALALGPNINLDVDAERERAAHDAVRRASRLARRGPAIEREYVEALAHRYSRDPNPDLGALARAYTAAMAGLVRRHPDDLDAATLYAESAMDLRPWKLWTRDGQPAEGTLELVAVLESVLRRDPNHPGANHYLIHALEASPYPERALPSAARLETLVPGAGHLVHMPAHVYMRTGDFAGSIRSNRRAIEVDRAHFGDAGPRGTYALLYYAHNIHFLAAAAVMAGREDEAREAAGELVQTVETVLAAPGLDPMVAGMAEFLLPTPLWVALRFGRLDEVLASPSPPADRPLATACWRFARGVAFAARKRLGEARTERDTFAAARRAVPPEAVMGLNPADAVLGVAALVLDARLAAAEGDRPRAVLRWHEAVAAEDGLAYNEPPDWFYPVRESLGAALLASDPREAEAVFRADLEHNPRNPRSLFGLAESLRAQRRGADAALVQVQYEVAWRDAPRPLRRDDL
jgi:tetratricopeptide (TPR) repeat protein